MTEITAAQESGQPLDKSLVRDFYYSFQFSQGDEFLQRKLWTCLSEQYQQQFGSDIDYRQFTGNAPEQFSIPQGHIIHARKGIVTPDNVKTESNMRWKQYLEGLASKNPDSYAAEEVLYYMIENDIHFVQAGRGEKRDDFTSHFKKYIVEGERTANSIPFNAILDKLSRMYESRENGELLVPIKAFPSIRKRAMHFHNRYDMPMPQTVDVLTHLPKLQKLWKQKHPGKTFFKQPSE